MTATRRRLLLIIAVVSLGVILVLTLKSRRSPAFDSLDDFSVAWKATPIADRHELVGWLLGESPRRHTTYSLDNCRLRGLNKEEVFAILGSATDFDGEVAYSIGSIEYDFLHIKADVLFIRFDADGIVTEVFITS